MKTQVSKSVIVALLSNLFVSIIKLIGYFVSLSPSMLSEAVHSFADTLNQAFLLIGEKSSSLKPTKEHPFGKGSYLYLFNFVSAVGIFLIGCSVSVYHSLHALMNPTTVSLNIVFWISLVILLISFVVEGYSLLAVIKEINHSKRSQSFYNYVFKGTNPTLSAVFLEDSIAVLGVGLALVGQVLSQILKTSTPDAVFGLIIGLILGVIALFLGYVNSQFLIGKSVDSQVEDVIKEYLESFPLIEKVYDMKTEILKPNAIAVMAEIEVNGSAVFNNDHIEAQLDRDCEEIQKLMLDDVDDTLRLKRIVIKIYDRSNRIFGKQLDEIQAKVKQEFPDVVLITLEIR